MRPGPPQGRSAATSFAHSCKLEACSTLSAPLFSPRGNLRALTAEADWCYRDRFACDFARRARAAGSAAS